LKEIQNSDSLYVGSKQKQPRVFIHNMTSLLIKAYSVQGVYEFCDKNLTSLIFVKSNCSCKPTCFFEGYFTYCVETALEYPVSCYSEKFLSRENYKGHDNPQGRYAMVDGRPNTGINSRIQHRCENPFNRDIFNMVPVLDENSNTIYQSFDCYICNQPGL